MLPWQYGSCFRIWVPTHEAIRSYTANWRSWRATVCFICDRNIVFRHKINFSVEVERVVCFSCFGLCFICVSFEFTLGSCVFTLRLWLLSSTWWTKNCKTSSTSWTQSNLEHTLAPTCWVTGIYPAASARRYVLIYICVCVFLGIYIDNIKWWVMIKHKKHYLIRIEWVIILASDSISTFI